MFKSHFRQDLDKSEFWQFRIMRFQSYPGRFSVIFACAVTSFSENDGLDRCQSVLSSQRCCAASQALMAGRGALRWDTTTGTYGDFVSHPSNSSVSASGMLCSSILQRVVVVASTMPRSCHCELKESWQMPPMGRNMLADHH